MYIYKQSGANTVQVSEGVWREVDKIHAEGLPVRMESTWDSANFIRASISNVNDAALAGAGLAIFVLLFFLRSFSSMLIIGVDYRPTGPFAQVQFAYLDEDRYFHTPAELNFGRLVNFKRGTDFLGRKALEAEAQQDRPGKVMRGLDIDPAGIAALYESAGTPPFLSPRLHRHFKSEILAGETNVGFATSMCWSPVLETMIGFAHIESPEVDVGTDVALTWQIYNGRGEAVDGEVPARVVDLPFVEMKRRRIG